MNKKVTKLNRHKDFYKALIRNSVKDLIKNGYITVTFKKANPIIRKFDKLIK
mgnify:CR=1 FL=1